MADRRAPSTEISRVLRILGQPSSGVRIVESTSSEGCHHATISHPGGVVEGDVWHLAEWLCQNGLVRIDGNASATSLLRQPERQRRWIASSHPVDPAQLEALFSDGSSMPAFLCGDQPVLADLYVSIHLCSQQWDKDNDHNYPHTLDWISRVQKAFPSWVAIQSDMYLMAEAGALDEADPLVSSSSHCLLTAPATTRHHFPATA